MYKNLRILQNDEVLPPQVYQECVEYKKHVLSNWFKDD